MAAIRPAAPGATVEILTPDFLRKPGARRDRHRRRRPDVFNHNLETVPRLYHPIRPGARYYASLRLLERAKELDPDQFTKSGLMLGLGEARDEVLQVMDDMRCAGVDFLTLGQYLQPSRKHAAVERALRPAGRVRRAGDHRLCEGLPHGSGEPADARSSHHAGEDFERLRAARARASPASTGPCAISLTRRLPYAPQQLFELVGDVESAIRSSCPGCCAALHAATAGRTGRGSPASTPTARGRLLDRA